MHVELNFEKNNNNISNILMANPHIQTNKNQMLDIYLKDFQNNNKSIISDLFYGTYETIYFIIMLSGIWEKNKKEGFFDKYSKALL